jgi:hypothetical protein
MIFNTKTITPMQTSSNSFFSPNKYIPSNRRDSDKDSNNSEGRQIYYETTLVSTPVLVSARLNPKDPSPTKRLLTKSDVDDLNHMLLSLCVSSDKVKPVATTKSTGPLSGSGSNRVAKREVSFTEETKQDDKYVNSNNDTSKGGLGRYEERVYDAKSQTTKVVLRSYRLKAKCVN